MSISPQISRLQQLRQQVRDSALNEPGTYRMLGEGGEVIYVGKSKRLRTRLLSYFRARRGEKGHAIIREAASLDWSYEPGEFAALLRELELIRRHRPRFNVQYKRDAVYSFLKLSAGSAPKLYVVRTVADDPATYFGPFRGGKRVSAGVRELNDLLGLRDCALSTPIRFADQTDLFSPRMDARCHRFEMDRCLGPCAALCTESAYRARIALARRFLDGDIDGPLLRLKERMADAAGRWEFEHAAALRDRARRLEELRDQFLQLREALDTLSFLYRVDGAEAGGRIYLIRRGTVRAVFAPPETAAARRDLRQAVDRCFAAPETPTAVVDRHQVAEILLIARWFRRNPDELERTAPPERTGRLMKPPRATTALT